MIRVRSLSLGLLAALVLGLRPAAGQTPPPAPVALPDPLGHAAAAALMLEGNRQIRLARRALEVASSDIRRADVLPNPTLSGSVSNTVARSYRGAETDRILRIEQVFERGDKRALRVGVARAAEQAARLDLADVTRQQRVALASAYFDLLAAQELARIADENVAGYLRLVEAAQRRLRLGDIAAVDVSRLRVEASRAENDARAARGALQQAQVGLAAVLGLESRAAQLRAADAFPDLDAQPADLPLPPTAERIEAALRSRADAAAARARVAALAKARELAERQRTRDLTVGLQTEHAPSFGGSVFGVSASIPLLLNNDYSGEILRAHAEHGQALEDEQRVLGAIRADIERSAAQAATALDRARRIAGTALPEARRAAEGMEFAFGRGAAALTDLFDARRQFAAVRAEAVVTRAEHAKALAAYREALAVETLAVETQSVETSR